MPHIPPTYCISNACFLVHSNFSRDAFDCSTPTRTRGNRLDSKDLLWENWHCWYFLLQPSRCTVRIKDLCTSYIPWYWIFSLRATTLWKFRFYWVMLKLQLHVEEFCIINFLLCFLFFVRFYACKKNNSLRRVISKQDKNETRTKRRNKKDKQDKNETRTKWNKNEMK